jgi:hypothetical protein
LPFADLIPETHLRQKKSPVSLKQEGDKPLRHFHVFTVLLPEIGETLLLVASGGKPEQP